MANGDRVRVIAASNGAELAQVVAKGCRAESMAG
jgi:hypothetical protein